MLRVDRGEPSRRPRACRQEPSSHPRPPQPRTFWKPCSPDASGGWPGPARPPVTPPAAGQFAWEAAWGSSPGPLTASRGPGLLSDSSYSADPREAQGGSSGVENSRRQWAAELKTQRLSSRPHLRPTCSRALAATLRVGEGMASGEKVRAHDQAGATPSRGRSEDIGVQAGHQQSSGSPPTMQTHVRGAHAREQGPAHGHPPTIS